MAISIMEKRLYESSYNYKIISHYHLSLYTFDINLVACILIAVRRDELNHNILVVFL